MKAPNTPQRRRRWNRPAHLGFTIHASRGIAPSLYAMFQCLANGTPKQRKSADEFRQSILALKGGAA